MKDFSIIIIFIFACLSLHSQSITEDGNVWHISNYEDWTGNTRTQIYSLQGDTMINDLIYKKIYGVNDTIAQPQASLSALIRQDTDKKVYFFENGEESILYDFNAEVGDTLYFENLQPIWVKSIDSVQLFNGEWRKRWQYTCGLINPNTDIYFSEVVDGIGSTSAHLFDYYWACYPDYSRFFRCFSSYSEILYNSANSEEFECYFYSVDVNEVKGEFSINPNPTTNLINIKVENLDIHLNSVDIYSLNGQLSKREKNISADFQIDVSTLPKGLYFLRMISDNGQVFSSRFVKN